MITSKQRAQLRGMAAALNTELQIGKSGITENVVRQAEEALAAAGLRPDVRGEAVSIEEFARLSDRIGAHRSV